MSARIRISPVTDPTVKKTLYDLVDEVVIESPRLEAPLIIPAGYRFDGASIPRAAWSAIGYTPFHPRVVGAALPHDFLYEQEGPCSRRVADDIFLDILLEDGVPESDALLMYRAVRTFGRMFWLDEEDKALGNVIDTTAEDFSI